MSMRPYLLILLAAFFMSGCGSAEYPGKPRSGSIGGRGAAKASAEDDLSAATFVKKELEQEIASASPRNGDVVSAVLQDDGAYEPNEDHLYIHAEEPLADTRLAFLGPMDDYTEDAVLAEGAEPRPDPSANETDCDYLSPGDPGYSRLCKPAEVLN